MPATYTGPRFPGGPDSLRVYLSRHALRTGHTFVQFDVLPTDQLHKPVLKYPGSKPPTIAQSAAAMRIVKAMPAWTLGRQDVDIPITTVTLCLSDNRRTAALAYADEMPVFPGMEPGIIGLYRFLPDVLVSPPKSYWDEKFRGKDEGQTPENEFVYAYFEVSETGRIENTQIINGTSTVLNDAALQTIAKLPAATTPAQLKGQAVRIYYVLSIGYTLD